MFLATVVDRYERLIRKDVVVNEYSAACWCCGFPWRLGLQQESLAGWMLSVFLYSDLYVGVQFGVEGLKGRYLIGCQTMFDDNEGGKFKWTDLNASFIDPARTIRPSQHPGLYTLTDSCDPEQCKRMTAWPLDIIFLHRKSPKYA